MVDRTVNMRFKGRDDSGPAFRSVQNNLRGLQSNIGNVTGLFSAFTGVAAGLGLAKVFNEAVEATQRYQQSTLRLDAVMKATGGTVGLTRKELENFVLAMERDTVFAQNEIRDATAIMATFKSVQGETFQEGVKLAADMSAVMDQSLKSSVVQLGKALEDPVRGLASLREVGVSFTAAQEEMIEGMVEAGEKAEAQRVILDALEGQFGGTAGRMNQGIYGAVTSTREAYDRFLVELGKTPAIQGAVTAPLTSLTAMLDGLTEALERNNRSIIDHPLIGPGGELRQPLDLNKGKSAFSESETQQPEPPRMRPAPGTSAEANAAAAAKRDADAIARAAAEEEKREAAKKAAAEAAKKRAEEEKERMAEAAYLSKLYADEQVAAVKAHEAAIARAIEKQKAELEYQQGVDAMIDEIANERTEQEQAETKAMQDKLQALSDSLATESELLQTWYDERFELIQQAEEQGFEITGGWQQQKLRLVEEYERERTRLHDEEIKKRYGISTVYRKLDLQSSQFFFGQMAQMMESGSRTFFEIGKAGAIAETIIQTYRAAQGAYAALAAIPFVGPALGAAAAGAAIVAGLARVQAIRNTQFGSGSAASPVFNANPSTGQPTDFGPPTEPLFQPPGEATVAQQRNVNIQIISDGGVVSEGWVRNKLIPSINEAVGDGVTVSTI